MLKTNIKQKGFTIVELLIVIVIIGILAMLVLNTFSGAQQKARDTERQTDANSVAKQLEAYYAEKGGYPTFAQFGTTPTTAAALLKGTSENAYQAPGASGATFSWQASTTTNKDNYGYVASTAPTGGAFAACTTGTDTCQSFVITYWSEKDNTSKEIKSLN